MNDKPTGKKMTCLSGLSAHSRGLSVCVGGGGEGEEMCVEKFCKTFSPGTSINKTSSL